VDVAFLQVGQLSRIIGRFPERRIWEPVIIRYFI
jgi:hypothetical protein